MAGGYLQINSIEDVDFQSILNDYINIFTRQYIVIETNYKKLSELKIVFAKHDIHHLLGFHKIQDSNINATKTLSKILEGTLNLENAKTHPNFGEVKNRLINYNFLHHCFVDQSVKLCVVVNGPPNPQGLSVVFIDKHKNENVLLGLKKARGRDYYVPATLYVINDSSVYTRKRRSNVKSISWQNY